MNPGYILNLTLTRVKESEPVTKPGSLPYETQVH